MLFIGGPLNRQHIEVIQNTYRYTYISPYNLCSFNTLSRYMNHYYYKEKITGQKQTFYVMRYMEITIDKMLEILIEGK